MSAEFEGFYATYFTGIVGSSLGLFTFRDGGIAGADMGGGKYNGSYTIDPRNSFAHCVVNFVLPIGNQSITGAIAANEPISLAVSVVLPTKLDPALYHRIETPIGPINARFEKLRGFEA